MFTFVVTSRLLWHRLALLRSTRYIKNNKQTQLKYQSHHASIDTTQHISIPPLVLYTDVNPQSFT